MAWVELDYQKHARMFPSISCCYALYFNGMLKYIGSTKNLRNRFSGHGIRHGYAKDIITPWGDFPNSVGIVIKYKPSKRYGDWLMVEARLIRRLQPEFNKMLKGRKNALLSA
jgi:excinuclease UvrABC nuclease subunit